MYVQALCLAMQCMAFSSITSLCLCLCLFNFLCLCLRLCLAIQCMHALHGLFFHNQSNTCCKEINRSEGTTGSNWIVINITTIREAFLPKEAECYEMISHTCNLSFFVRQHNFQKFKLYAEKCVNLPQKKRA